MAFIFESAVGDKESSRAYRILLVDSNIEMQATLTVLLQVDFQIDTASTVSEGLHYLNAFSPDLVILDIALPDLDGTYFLRTLRARHLACPVIVITASSQAEALQKMATLRIEGFFRKPFHLDIHFVNPVPVHFG